jgi:hypothetical protein
MHRWNSLEMTNSLENNYFNTIWILFLYNIRIFLSQFILNFIIYIKNSLNALRKIKKNKIYILLNILLPSNHRKMKHSSFDYFQ